MKLRKWTATKDINTSGRRTGLTTTAGRYAHQKQETNYLPVTLGQQSNFSTLLIEALDESDDGSVVFIELSSQFKEGIYGRLTSRR